MPPPPRRHWLGAAVAATRIGLTWKLMIQSTMFEFQGVWNDLQSANDGEGSSMEVAGI
jgi:hypothetical protein